MSILSNFCFSSSFSIPILNPLLLNFDSLQLLLIFFRILLIPILLRSSYSSLQRNRGSEERKEFVYFVRSFFPDDFQKGFSRGICTCEKSSFQPLKSIGSLSPPPSCLMPRPGGRAPRSVTLITDDEIGSIVTGGVEQIMEAKHAPVYFERYEVHAKAQLRF
ncbi:unnamed protein product [Linum tenue]|uniref:Uncharacterized protein n=1 Tax=Linum tenue TaxID=586396 RepID=A0AAV0GR06_9ROSI|nr:unnamed protein product [Linum tenue]